MTDRIKRRGLLWILPVLLAVAEQCMVIMRSANLPAAFLETDRIVPGSVLSRFLKILSCMEKVMECR